MPSMKLDFPDSTSISDEERKVVKNSLTCILCSETFLHESTLKRHAKFHLKEAAFSCNVCHKNFNKKSQLKLHEKVQTCEKSYPCSICTESFTNRSHLFSHLQNHNSKNLFKCLVCGKCFTNRYTLKRHIKTHSSDNNTIQGRKNILYKSINCTLCSKTFSDKRSLKQHEKLHTKESSFICDVCFKGFSLEVDLNSHMKVHTTDKCHQCKICGTNFLYITNLTEHIRNHSDSQFNCTVCGKCFKRRVQLKLHMKVHPSAIMDMSPKHNLEVADLNKPSELLFKKGKENKSPIRLENANISNQDRKIETSRRNLRQQEKLFKCHVCFDEFYRKCSLKSHMKIHSDDKVQIKVATFSTSVVPSQQNHISELSYSIDSKSLIEDETKMDDVPLISLLPIFFSYKHKLRQQRKAQSAERTFTCNICFNVVYQKAKLKEHMKVHYGEKPFQCKNYSETFDMKDHRNINLSLESVECKKFFMESSRPEQHIKTHIPSESLISYNNLESNPSNIDSLGKELTVDEEMAPAIECAHLSSSKLPNLNLENIASKSVSCNVCLKTFPSKITLRRHRKSHSNKSAFTCNVCSKRFYVKSKLKLHKRLCTGKKLYQRKTSFSHSKICSKKQHLKTHSRDSKETISKEFHEKSVDSEDEKVLNIKCMSNEPDKKTLGKDIKERSIELENRSIHTRIERKISSKMSDDFSEFFIRERRIEKDHEFKKSTDNDHDKLLMRQNATENNFEILSEYIKRPNKRMTVRTVDIELTKEKPFQCKLCNKTYSKARKLKNHEKNVHVGKNLTEKTLQCRFCSKKYSSKKKLRKHEKRYSIGKDSNLEDFELIESFNHFLQLLIVKDNRSSLTYMTP